MVEVAGNRESRIDKAWADGTRRRHRERVLTSANKRGLLTGEDGKIYPSAIFDVIAELAEPDYIAIADGGDLLSFARTGLRATTYMDAGAFAMPGRQVISVNGDGAFGINAMEIDTAVRHGAKCVFVVSNNAAWNIERLDQEMNYGGRVIGTTLRHSDYAAMARALGLHGERVEKPEGLRPALQRALQNSPALVEVVTSQTVLSSDAQKGLGFVPDYQALTAWDEAERKRRQL
jgi:acetolactate synthase-1/2/3 large subunit